MMYENVTVEEVSVKPVTTRYGSKNTYSFKAGGEWFRTNFKSSGVSVGDVVTFDCNPGKYGNEVDPASIKKGGVVAVPIVPKGPVGAAPAYAGRHGSFPIGPLDGQRSILRQNALTNARELVIGFGGLKPAEGWEEKQKQYPLLADEIIRVARKFEQYTSGDMDVTRAEELEAAAKK